MKKSEKSLDRFARLAHMLRTKGRRIVLMKKLIVVSAALPLAFAPVVAQAAPSMQAAAVARAGTPSGGQEQELRGTSVVIAVLALIAFITAIALAASGDNNSQSN
jgi:hypothetical protein